MIKIILYILRDGVDKKDSIEITDYLNRVLAKFPFLHIPYNIVPSLFKNPRLPRRYKELITEEEGIYTIQANQLVESNTLHKNIKRFAKGFLNLQKQLKNTGITRLIYLEGNLQGKPLVGTFEIKTLLNSASRLNLIIINNNKTLVELNQSSKAETLITALNKVCEDIDESEQIGYGDQFTSNQFYDPLKKERYEFLTGKITPNNFAAKDSITNKDVNTDFRIREVHSTEELEIEKTQLKKSDGDKKHIRERVVEIEEETKSIKHQDNQETSFNEAIEDIDVFELGFYKSLIYKGIPNATSSAILSDEEEVKIFQGAQLSNIPAHDAKRAFLMIKNPEISETEDWEIIYECLGVKGYIENPLSESITRFLNQNCSPSESLLNMLDSNDIFEEFKNESDFHHILEEVGRNNIITEVEKKYLLEKAKDYDIDVHKLENLIKSRYTGHFSFKKLLIEVLKDGIITENEKAYIDEKASEYNFPQEEVEEMIQNVSIKLSLANTSLDSNLKEIWSRMFFMDNFSISKKIVKKIKHDIFMFLRTGKEIMPSELKINSMLQEIDEAMTHEIKLKYNIQSNSFKFNFNNFIKLTKDLNFEASEVKRMLNKERDIDQLKVLKAYEEIKTDLSINDKILLERFINKIGYEI